MRGVYSLVEAEDPQHVDERWIEMARGQLQGLVGARGGVGDDAERIGGAEGLRVGVHGECAFPGPRTSGVLRCERS